MMSQPTQPIYRVYALYAARLEVDLLHAENDEDAVAAAQATHPDGKCELWEGRRLVAAFDADRAAAQ